MRVYGIAAAQNPDNSGETIVIDNIDTSRLRVLNDEHGSDAWSILGSIDYHKKIHGQEECEDDYQRRCWDHCQVPFLYVRGEIAEKSGHPNAVAAASLLKFTAAKPELPLRIGWSIEGGILERAGADNKILNKTIATGASFTVKPCNPKAAMFIEQDLAKSVWTDAPPAVYYEALAKSEAAHSFIDRPKVVLLMQLDLLAKSTADYFGAFTSMKCWKCGHGVRFFKSSRDIPNRCQHCSQSFKMSDIWSAMNKKEN